MQGSGAFTFSGVSAKQEGNPNEASGTVEGFGGLAYLGYKWAHVFCDIGLGYQGFQGDLSFDNGKEATIAKTGPFPDANLGFGF